MGKHAKKSSWGRGSSPRREPAGTDQARPARAAGDTPGGRPSDKPRQPVSQGAAKASRSQAAPSRTRNPDPAERYRDEARIKRRRTKTVVFSILAVIGLLCLAGGAWAWTLARSVESDISSQVASDPQIMKELTKKPLIKKKKEPFTILLLGVDHLGVKGDTRSDTIILGRVDPETKKVWLLSIPRDARAEVPGYGVRKINSAYQLGGPALTIKTVAQMTGVRPDHYVEIDIGGFKHIVDVMGGVWINVDQRINDPKAAGANYGRKGAVIEKGYQKLDKNQAIVYVRSRAFADADFSRMRHQQEFLKAVAKQASSTSMLPRLPKIIRTMARYVNTDLTLGQMIGVVRDMRGVDPKNFQTATVPGEWRSPFVWPDEAKMAELVAKMQAGEQFKAPLDPKTVVPANYTIAVRNGSGITGLATTAAGLLRPQGWKIGEIANAKRQDYTKTLIIYKPENEAVAKRVQTSLKKGTLLSDVGNKYTFTGDVLVVVGQDWRSTATSSASPGRISSSPTSRSRRRRVQTRGPLALAAPLSPRSDHVAQHTDQAVGLVVSVELLLRDFACVRTHAGAGLCIRRQRLDRVGELHRILRLDEQPCVVVDHERPGPPG